MKTTLSFLRKGMPICGLFFCLFFSTFIHAEEETAFSLICPGDVWINCDEEIWNLSIYGDAYYHDYTGTHPAGTPWVEYNLNSCNVGTITRTWTVEDYNWNIHTCTQTIHVSSNGAFTEANIYWPEEHLELEGCNPDTDPYSLPYGYGPPTYDYLACSLIGKSYKDQVFWFGPTCKKIIRKWTLIDWCQYDPNNYGSSGIWVFYQFIKISTAEIPVLTCEPEIIGNSYNCENAIVEVDPIEVDGNACGGYFEITNNSPYAYSDGADISGVYPIGTTKVKVDVKYGCSKTKTCHINVIVEDSKGPTPYCLATIATALMPVDDDEDGIPEDGMVEVWAKDLDYGSYSSCHPGPLKFSFSSDVDDTFRTYNCDQVGENEEEMWVTDIKGNQSWCKVIIDVQNNSADIPDCQPDPDDGEGDGNNDTYSLRGAVMSPTEEPLANVILSLVDQTPLETYVISEEPQIIIHYDTIINSSGFIMINEWHDTIAEATIDTILTYYEMNTNTIEDGAYEYEDMLEKDKNYKISGAVENEIEEAINEADVTRLMAHLIGTEPFDNAYEYIAADVDNSGVVDFEDLKFLLLHTSSEDNAFPIEDIWVIMDAAHQFESPELAITKDCPTTISLLEIHEDMEGVDFVAIRKGDLVSEDENRTSGSFTATIPANEIIKGIDKKDMVTTETLIRDYIDGISNVSIIPNPFDEAIKLSYLSTSTGSIKLELTDINGRKILAQSFNINRGANQFNIETSTLNSGVYIYSIYSSSGIQSGKLIKK